MIKVVIFDFDGVLFDSNQAWVELFNQASREAGAERSFTFEDIRSQCGKPYMDVLNHAFPGIHNDSGALAAMYSNFLKIAKTDEFLASFREIKGMKGSLRMLKRKFKLAVGSGNSRKLLNRFIYKLGFSKYFDLVVSSDDVSRGKPNPDMILKVVRHFRVSPGEAVYVGDSCSDFIAAKRANVRSVAVLSGALSREQAEELCPDFIVGDATELQELLSCM